MTKFPSTPGTQGPSGMSQASIATIKKESPATATYWQRAGLTREQLSGANYLEKFWRISDLLQKLQRTGENILSCHEHHKRTSSPGQRLQRMRWLFLIFWATMDTKWWVQGTPWITGWSGHWRGNILKFIKMSCRFCNDNFYFINVGYTIFSLQSHDLLC